MAFRWQDQIDASGGADLITGAYRLDATEHTTRVQLTSVKQNMPWKLRAGLRYADRLAPRSYDAGHVLHGPSTRAPLHDPLQDERWDVELDVEYQGNSVNREQEVSYGLNQHIDFVNGMGTLQSPPVGFPDSTRPNTYVEKHWKDQVSVRAGGSYNILPGPFGVMAGAHFENRGVDASYMQIDYWPVQRIGLHGGVMVRLFGNTDLVVSYAHIIQETVVVGAPSQENANTIFDRYKLNLAPVTTIDRTVGTQISRTDMLLPLYENAPKHLDAAAKLNEVVTKTSGGQPPWIVNSGTYHSGIDVIAVGLHAHF